MDEDDDTPTTRKFPRSTREAFPDERAKWLDRPQRAVRLMATIVVVAFGVLLVLMCTALSPPP
jgi:hypothetical protein